MKFILGTKQNMVQYFTPEGRSLPATLIDAGPAMVVQVKNKETDGYNAVQVGYGEQKLIRISKPKTGHLKGLGNFKHLKEFRLTDEEVKNMKPGDTLLVSGFEKGDTVQITGVSKGKGFQGVVKRHGFHGGPRSHGQKHSEREPGSIGGGLRTRVPKGMRMAGRMGSDVITIKNLQVLEIDQENNKLLIKGAIPGRRGTLIQVRG